MVKCLYPNLKETLHSRYETESTSLAKCPLRQVWREGLGQWNPKCPGMAMSNWREVLALGSSQRLVHWKTSPSGHIYTSFSHKVIHTARGTVPATPVTGGENRGLTQGKECVLRVGRPQLKKGSLSVTQGSAPLTLYLTT